MLPRTMAEFWDCQLERAELGSKYVSHLLVDFVLANNGRTSNYDIQAQLKDLAVKKAAEVVCHGGDRVLTFEDGSRLALVADGANTMVGISRVMEPGELDVRGKVRGGRPYLHGKTRSATFWTRKENWEDLDIPVIKSGDICQKTGFWVRMFGGGKCVNPGTVLKYMESGEPAEHCSDCSINASYGWAYP